MNCSLFGHRHADVEIPASIQNEIQRAITESNVAVTRGNLAALRDSVLQRLMRDGWSPEVEIDPNSRISITSSKEHIGLCLQTGNMGRMYADLLKLQTLYLRETIYAGVIIMLADDAAKELGDNLANADRLRRELPIFSRSITVPILLVGITD